MIYQLLFLGLIPVFIAAQQKVETKVTAEQSQLSERARKILHNYELKLQADGSLKSDIITHCFNGKHLLVLTYQYTLDGSVDQQIVDLLGDVESGTVTIKKLIVFPSPKQGRAAIALGKEICAVLLGNGLEIYDTTTCEKCVNQKKAPDICSKDAMVSVAISSDDQYIAVAGKDQFGQHVVSMRLAQSHLNAMLTAPISHVEFLYGFKRDHMRNLLVIAQENGTIRVGYEYMMIIHSAYYWTMEFVLNKDQDSCNLFQPPFNLQISGPFMIVIDCKGNRALLDVDKEKIICISDFSKRFDVVTKVKAGLDPRFENIPEQVWQMFTGNETKSTTLSCQSLIQFVQRNYKNMLLGCAVVAGIVAYMYKLRSSKAIFQKVV